MTDTATDAVNNWWAVIDNRTSELVGVSTEAQTRAEFEEECAASVPDWDRVKHHHSIREATRGELHKVQGEPEWLSDVIDLVRRARERPIDVSVPGAIESAQNTDTVNNCSMRFERWQIVLTYHTNGPDGPFYYASFRPDHPALFMDSESVVMMAQMLLTMGAMELPPQINDDPVKDGKVYFAFKAQS